jgi:hypothetical protein
VLLGRPVRAARGTAGQCYDWKRVTGGSLVRVLIVPCCTEIHPSICIRVSDQKGAKLKVGRKRECKEGLIVRLR